MTHAIHRPPAMTMTITNTHTKTKTEKFQGKWFNEYRFEYTVLMYIGWDVPAHDTHTGQDRIEGILRLLVRGPRGSKNPIDYHFQGKFINFCADGFIWFCDIRGKSYHDFQTAQILE